MQFAQDLIPGRLVRRYKRFLADAVLEDGTEVTAHCANPGAMTGLAEPGMRIWLEPTRDPKRKLRFSWRLVELAGGHWAGIDTAVPNRVVGEALRAGRIPALAAYPEIRPEVAYGSRSRVDFLARGAGLPDAYIEVKNVHLRRAEDWAEFPDSVTARGAKHLGELARVAGEGHRAVMLYCVQRDDCARLRLAGDIDPGYARAAEAAAAAGVEMMAWACRLGPREILLDRPLPIAI
ncbi:DNA/RNA nuclease SfsA [Paralimibaculum aggregatum]|uniref:Sugar fermentation stimulation protein homolog n=1 Tax=Paralimibaculum aggregatum TaxID=3036245 RepID=A0ABQ6LIM2_9RHOB|nr:DNA/RNA nuclease SfsA [Limibaculum sp. NKW23]GMG82827.1 DNA/RNA nuclease SfsA [Limibaculum sp. NKW23]